MNILVIDDEQEILNSMDTFLSLRGYDVITASDPEEGLEIHREQDVKLVLLDINMPGVDGLDVLKSIKETGFTTEVVMITGYNSLDKTLKARELGASDYLLKPFEDMDRIGQIIDQTTERIERWQEAFEDGLRQKRLKRTKEED